MQFNLQTKSKNGKLGGLPAVMSSPDCCPPSCPLKGKGCYAETGPISWAWRKHVNAPFSALLSFISDLPLGQMWRYATAGDLPGTGEAIDGAALSEMVKANAGRRGYTYTHKVPKGANRTAIKKANRAGFTINLSADDLREADEFVALGIAPVVVTLPSDQMENTVTPAGNRIVVCPHATRGTTCKDCGLCAWSKRKVIIGFPAHGARSAKLDERLAAS